MFLTLLLISNFGFSQVLLNNSVGSESKHSKLSIGDELIKSTNHYYTGVGISAIGIATGIVGALIQPKQNYKNQWVPNGYGGYKTISVPSNKDYSNNYLIAGIGAVLLLIGEILILESRVHIKHAGNKINNRFTFVSFVAKSDKISVNYNF